MAWLNVLDRRRARSVGVAVANGKEEEGGKEALPMLMYSAINLQPAVTCAQHKLDDGDRSADVTAAALPPPSSAFVSLGYFSVILPGSLPPSHRPDTPLASNDSPTSLTIANEEEAAFWARAKSARSQGEDAVRHPDLLSRSLLMCEERAQRSIKFAMEDDGYVSRPSALTPPASTRSSPPTEPKVAQATTTTADETPKKSPPAAALIGLSLLGLVDPLFAFSAYAPHIRPSFIRIGTRKASGGVLLISYTFRKTLYLSLGWDEGAFEEGVVEAFWEEVRAIMGKYVVGEAEGGGGGFDVSGAERLE
jgi:hypothetical protein